jgi:hypothetical protein
MASGCSMARLGYDNLPTLAAWRADTYLSLNTEQKALATRRFESLHAWHRRTQLAEDLALIERAATETEVATRLYTIAMSVVRRDSTSPVRIWA